MKLNPSYGLLPILVVGLILSTPAIGQDEKSPMEYETTIREFKNDSVTSEVEIKTLSKPVIPAVSRETETPPATKTTKTPVKQADKTQKSPEDPLSFNFLYYIIEKFKMSDMIE